MEIKKTPQRGRKGKNTKRKGEKRGEMGERKLKKVDRQRKVNNKKESQINGENRRGEKSRKGRVIRDEHCNEGEKGERVDKRGKSR